jgi:hypothetical protein
MPDGRLMVLGNKCVDVCDPKTGRTLASGGRNQFNAPTIAFSGTRVSLGGEVFDFEKNAIVPPPKGVGTVILMSPDQSWCVKYSPAEQRYAWARSSAPRELVPLGEAGMNTVPSFAGPHLIARTGAKLCAHSTETGAILRSLQVSEKSVVFASRDGRRLAVYTPERELQVLDFETFEVAARFECGRTFAAAFTKNGRRLYVVHSGRLASFDVDAK